MSAALGVACRYCDGPRPNCLQLFACAPRRWDAPREATFCAARLQHSYCISLPATWGALLSCRCSHAWACATAHSFRLPLGIMPPVAELAHRHVFVPAGVEVARRRHPSHVDGARCPPCRALTTADEQARSGAGGRTLRTQRARRCTSRATLHLGARW